MISFGGPAPHLASSPVSPESAAQDFLERLKTPCRLLVAYSGGGDSTGLLVALARRLRASPGLDVTLIAATVDHGLRPGSADEARAVGALCEQLSIPHHILTWEGEKPRTGIQAAAREARYRLLGNLARTLDIDAIVTAHNFDDQIETMAMRKARNPDAAGGISAAVLYDRHVWVCRPFLNVRRDAIRDYLTACGIGWVDDPSNDNDGFERVRVRKALAAGEATQEPMNYSSGIKTLSGLPAISPTRGEKTRSAFPASIEVRRGVGLSPSPLWGGVGEGSLPESEPLDSEDRIARLLLDNTVIHSARVAMVDLSQFSPSNSANIDAIRHLAALMGGRTHLAAAETKGRIADFLANTDERRLTAERVVLDRRKHLLYITRERRSLPVVAVESGATALWDNRFRIENQGMQPAVVGARIAGQAGRALIGGDLPASLPGAVRQRVEATQPMLFDGDPHHLNVKPIVPQFDRFLPLQKLAVANALAFLGGLDHFPGLPTR